MIDQAQLDRLCIDTIRTLSIDAIQKAHSGHPGTPMGAARQASKKRGRRTNSGGSGRRRMARA